MIFKRKQATAESPVCMGEHGLHAECEDCRHRDECMLITSRRERNQMVDKLKSKTREMHIVVHDDDNVHTEPGV